MALKGIKVLELCGLAPSPYCGKILSDFGASVIRVDRHPRKITYADFLGYGKKSLSLDLKCEEGQKIVLKLSEKSDVLIEPFRSGVMEKLGLGPDLLCQKNPKLIYARLSGFGQNGPLKEKAGHDINFVALSGLLSRFGRKNEIPSPPVNLIGDFAGGGLLCAFGIVAALFERSISGSGQVVDCSMKDGAAYLGSWLYSSNNNEMLWGKNRGENLLDTGTHFYETYETKDGKFFSVGAVEPKFYLKLIENIGLSYEDCPQFGENYDDSKAKFIQIFKSKTWKEWKELFKDEDVCATPVFELNEAIQEYPASFVETEDKNYIPVAAPVLSRTPPKVKVRAPQVGENTIEILTEYLNYNHEDIQKLSKSDVIFQKVDDS